MSATAKITYYLNSEGRKASVLAGGNGAEEQEIVVDREDAEFRRCVEFGSVRDDGTVTVQISRRQCCFSEPQTATTILDYLEEQRREEKRIADEAAEARRQATQDVLTNRKTRTVSDAVRLDRAGNEVGVYGPTYANAQYDCEIPDWPHNADESIVRSDEAAKWVAELEAAKQDAKQNALQQAEQRCLARLAEEEAKEQKRREEEEAENARKVELGAETDDLLLKVEDGALVEVPCWESHSRGKNWMAIITPDSSSPGGLSRRFQKKAKGKYYYLVCDLQPGQSMEFGADYYTGGGRKSPERWYGFIVAVADDCLVLRKCSTGKKAHTQAQAWLKEHGPTPVEDLVAQGLARINGEGAIVPNDPQDNND